MKPIIEPGLPTVFARMVRDRFDALARYNEYGNFGKTGSAAFVMDNGEEELVVHSGRLHTVHEWADRFFHEDIANALAGPPECGGAWLVLAAGKNEHMQVAVPVVVRVVRSALAVYSQGDTYRTAGTLHASDLDAITQAASMPTDKPVTSMASGKPVRYRGYNRDGHPVTVVRFAVDDEHEPGGVVGVRLSGEPNERVVRKLRRDADMERSLAASEIDRVVFSRGGMA